MSTNNNNVQIKDFQSLFDEEIRSYETKRLTAPGENYGSLMLAVSVTFKNSDKKLETVAKMVPDNEFIQKMFKTPITFRKELGLYRTVVPTLQAFQLEQGVQNVLDFFPKFYGGRMGVNAANLDEFDVNALILLENLKFSGYTTVDRTIGFDLATTKILLRDLAKLHGVALALKLKKPEVFKNKVLPYIESPNCFEEMPQIMKDRAFNDIKDILRASEKCAKFVDRYQTAVEFAEKCILNRIKPKEPFATLAHCDFWVNNTMIKFDANGRPIRNKMVDFQMTEYQSPAKDLTFFLFTSVQSDIIVNQYDKLVKEYHDHLIATLKEMKVEDVSMFNLVAFEEEIARVVKEQTVIQCTIMLRPIFEVSNLSAVEDLSVDQFDETHKTTREHDEKLCMVVGHFAEKNWI